MRGNVHSTLVHWAKIVLPLGALMLLSTVFFIAQSVKTESTIPFSEIQLVAQEARLNAPNFAGVTDEGAAFRIAAKSIKPDPETAERILADAPALVAVDPSEGRIAIRAGNAVLEPKSLYMNFSGLARIETSGGYIIETVGVEGDLESGHFETKGALEVITPFGGLSAGQLVVELGGEEGGARLLFQNGVNMTYQTKD